MKTKLVELSDSTFAKITYSMQTDHYLHRKFNESFKMEVIISKKGYSGEEGTFIRGLEVGDRYSTLIPDLQLYLNTSGPITGTAKIHSIEFLQSEYFTQSFRVSGSDYLKLEDAIKQLSEPVVYTKAEDFYNDLTKL